MRRSRLLVLSLVAVVAVVGAACVPPAPLPDASRTVSLEAGSSTELTETITGVHRVLNARVEGTAPGVSVTAVTVKDPVAVRISVSADTAAALQTSEFRVRTVSCRVDTGGLACPEWERVRLVVVLSVEVIPGGGANALAVGQTVPVPPIEPGATRDWTYEVSGPTTLDLALGGGEEGCPRLEVLSSAPDAEPLGLLEGCGTVPVRLPAPGLYVVRLSGDQPVPAGSFALTASSPTPGAPVAVPSSTPLPELLPGQRARVDLTAEFATELAAYAEGLDVEVFTEGELVATSASSVTKGALVTPPLAFAAHTVEVVNSSTQPLAAGRMLHVSVPVDEDLGVGVTPGPVLAPGGVARWPLDPIVGTLAVTTTGDRCVALRIYGDDGLIDEAAGCGGAHARVVGGTYVEAVNLADSPAGPGSWSVALRPVLDAGELPADGTPATVQVAAGQAAALGFTPAADSAVVFRLDPTAGDCRSLRVVDAADLMVAEGDGCGPDPVLVEAQLTGGGRYAVEVNDESPAGAAAIFSVRAEPLSEVTAGALAVGVDVTNPEIASGQRVRWDLDTGLPEPNLASLRVTQGAAPLVGCVAVEEIASGIVARHGQVCAGEDFEGYVSVGDGVDLRLTPTNGQSLPTQSVVVRLDAAAVEPAAANGIAAAAEINSSAPTERTGISSTPAAVGCADVLFLGARGSGQKENERFGFGPQVYAAMNAFRAALKPGISLEIKPLLGGYAANGVEAIGQVPNGTKSYFQGIQNGVNTGWSELNGPRSQQCPNQRIVLAGYSQGAMVMHRLFTDLVAERRANIVMRIDGVILIADGDRNTGDNISHRGTARRLGPSGVSRLWPKLSGVRGVTLRGEPRVHSICETTDAVCQPSWFGKRPAALSAGLLAVGIGVHTKGTTATSAVRGAAEAVAAQVSQKAGMRMIVPKVVRRNGAIPARIPVRSGSVCPSGTTSVGLSTAILTPNGFFGKSNVFSANPDGTWSVTDGPPLDSGRSPVRVLVGASCLGPNGEVLSEYMDQWVTVVN